MAAVCSVFFAALILCVFCVGPFCSVVLNVLSMFSNHLPGEVCFNCDLIVAVCVLRLFLMVPCICLLSVSVVSWSLLIKVLCV